jgi:hypothetical protein
MDKLIGAIVSLIEIMLLGSIALLFCGYAIATYHPIKNALIHYSKRLYNFVFRKKRRVDPKEGRVVLEDTRVVSKEGRESHELAFGAKVGIILGAIYFAGVLSNSAAYWLLHVPHNVIISQITEVESADGQERLPKVTGSSWRILIPIWLLWQGDDTEAEIAHARSLYREMQWRNTNHTAAVGSLDVINKYIRLLRGTAIFGLAFSIVAMLKIGMSFRAARLCTSAVGGAEQERQLANAIYVDWIDARRNSLAKERKRRDGTIEEATLRAPAAAPADFEAMNRIALANVLYPNVYVLVLSLTVYVVAICSWRTAELDYHSMIVAGEHSATKVSNRQSKDGPAKEGLTANPAADE